MTCRFVALLSVVFATAAIADAPEGHQLVWNDEFEGAALDPGKWEYRYLGPREGTVVSRESVRLDGKGRLVLTTFMRDATLHVGMVGTQRTFQARYGYFEARMRFQKLQGHHGAFWLQSPRYGKHLDDPGRSGAEVDIIEFFGTGRRDSGTSINIHWNPYPNPTSAGSKVDVARAHEDFHVYAVHWTEAGYRFFVDGKPVYATREGLSHTCQYLVLSLLSTPWERPRMPIFRLPDSMEVDYVRVYADASRRKDCPDPG